VLESKARKMALDVPLSFRLKWPVGKDFGKGEGAHIGSTKRQKKIVLELYLVWRFETKHGYGSRVSRNWQRPQAHIRKPNVTSTFHTLEERKGLLVRRLQTRAVPIEIHPMPKGSVKDCPGQRSETAGASPVWGGSPGRGVR